MALKGMSRSLSRRPEDPDYYRYGTDQHERYHELVVWLTRELLAIGTWGIEIWNEANVSHEWNDDIEALVALHRTSYEAIKIVAPQMTVLSGSANTWDFAYFVDFIEAGGAKYCDALAVHGYTYSPDKFIAYFDGLDRVLALAAFRTGSAGLKAHITEIGFRWPAFSLEEQAAYLVIFSLEAASRSNVDSILWFRYENVQPANGSQYDQSASTGYAMVGFRESYCRPGLAAYRFLDNWLQATKFVRIDNYDHDDRIYVFELLKGGEACFASYSPSRMHFAALSSLSTRRVFDCYGRRLMNDEHLDGLIYFFI